MADRDWTEGHANCEDLEAFVAEIEQETSEGCNATSVSGPPPKRARSSLDGLTSRDGMLQLVPFVRTTTSTDDVAATTSLNGCNQTNLQQQKQQKAQEDLPRNCGTRSNEQLVQCDSVGSGSTPCSPGLRQPQRIGPGSGFATGIWPGSSSLGNVNSGSNSRPMEASDGASLAGRPSPPALTRESPSSARAQAIPAVPPRVSPYSPHPQQYRVHLQQAGRHIAGPSQPPNEAQAQQGRGESGQQQGVTHEWHLQQQRGVQTSRRQGEGERMNQPLQHAQHRTQVQVQQQNKLQQQQQHETGRCGALPPSCNFNQSTALVPYCPHPTTPPPIPVLPLSSTAHGGSCSSSSRGQQQGMSSTGIIVGSHAARSHNKGGYSNVRASHREQQQQQQPQCRASNPMHGSMQMGEWGQAALRGGEDRRGKVLAQIGEGEGGVRSVSMGHANQLALQQQQQLVWCEAGGGSVVCVDGVQPSSMQVYGRQGDGSREMNGHPLALSPMAAMDHFLQLQQVAHRALDDSDYCTVQGRRFIKKSGWRKLACVFGVCFELRQHHDEFDPNTGFIVRSEFVFRASMPHMGRFADGCGSCSRHETNKRFTNPNHDIPATAETRAKSRACQDLIGVGEFKPKNERSRH